MKFFIESNSALEVPALLALKSAPEALRDSVQLVAVKGKGETGHEGLVRLEYPEFNYVIYKTIRQIFVRAEHEAEKLVPQAPASGSLESDVAQTQGCGSAAFCSKEKGNTCTTITTRTTKTAAGSKSVRPKSAVKKSSAVRPLKNKDGEMSNGGVIRSASRNSVGSIPGGGKGKGKSKTL